ncbi:MAG: EI24 domain-containing protein [Microcoleaceae cyanobacterium]
MSQPISPKPPGLIRAPIGFIAGASYPFRALSLLSSRPQLRKYVVIPLIVNFILGIILYLGLLLPGFHAIESLTLFIDSQIDTWVANLPSWLSYLDVVAIVIGWILRVVFTLALLVIIGFILLQFGVIIGSPWYGQLSEKLEEIKTGKPAVVPPASLTGVFQDIGRAILFELKKLVIQLGFGIPLLLLNFFPGFGTIIFTVGGIILTASMACLDFIDSPLERRRLKFREKLKMLRLALPASASFALVCLGLITIPFVNLLAIPICVASGTLFFCDRLWPYYFAPQESLTSSTPSPDQASS